MIKGLYENLALRWYRGGNIWLYSDPHFSDPEMVCLRKNYIGDAEQIKRINSKVGKNDTIIFLGDIGNLDCIKHIKGYKVLIMGNHDDKNASHYKRVIKHEKVDVDDYLNGKTPNELCFLPQEEQDAYYKEARRKAEEEYKSKPYFIRLSKVIMYDFHQPFMSWVAYYDNHLFDEVYEGPIYINNKIILSHEPAEFPFAFNIHGHDHSDWYPKDGLHLNVCAEHIDYTPISLLTLLKTGVASKVDDIHRITIDRATIKKAKR